MARLLQILSRFIKTKEYHQPNVKFIILGKYRVGSNFLSRILQEHGEIELDGEFFNISEVNKNPTRLKKPLVFIRDYFSKCSLATKAKGFKLMYNQLTTDDFNLDSWPPYTPKRIKNDIQEVQSRIEKNEIDSNYNSVRNILLTKPEIKIIHLIRKNLLNQLISTKRAFSEDNWLNREYENTQIYLSQEECLEFFQNTKNQIIYYRNQIKNSNVLELYYEDLVVNQDSTIEKTLNFLQVKNQKLSAEMKRQSVNPNDVILSNFYQLKKAFSNTKWNYLFENE